MLSLEDGFKSVAAAACTAQTVEQAARAFDELQRLHGRLKGATLTRPQARALYRLRAIADTAAVAAVRRTRIAQFDQRNDERRLAHRAILDLVADRQTASFTPELMFELAAGVADAIEPAPAVPEYDGVGLAMF